MRVSRWQQEFLTQAAPSLLDRFPFIVLGNKTDKSERMVSPPLILNIYIYIFLSTHTLCC